MFLVNTNTNIIEMWGAGSVENIDMTNYTLCDLDNSYHNDFKNFVESLNNIEGNDLPIEINMFFKYDSISNLIVKKSDGEIAESYEPLFIDKLDNKNTEYIKSRYSLERQSSFLMLKVDALELLNSPYLSEDKITKINEIIQELNKIKTFIMLYPLNYYYMMESEIKDTINGIKNNTKTLEDLYNLENTWDFEQFNQYDPNIHIETIKNMFMQL